MPAVGLSHIDRNFTRTLADAFPPADASDTLALVGDAALRLYDKTVATPRQEFRDNQIAQIQNVTGHNPSSVSAKGYRGPMMKRNESIAARTFADCSADIQESDVAKQVSACLVVDFAHYKSTPKVVARLAGASPQAAKNWLAGQHPPSLVSFLRLLPHSPSLRKLVAMESELSPDFTRELSALIQRHMR